MGLVKGGKALLYVSNFDGEKNQTGTINLPMITLHHYNYLDTNFSLYKSVKSDVGNVYNYYSILKQIRLYCLNGSATSFDANKYNLDSWHYSDGSLNPLYNNSYNSINQKVSYQNPIILHASTTFENITNGNIVIHGVSMESMSSSLQDTSAAHTGNMGVVIGYEVFDSNHDVIVQPGDTITFTMIVK